jgi:hypothetical protein
MESNKVPPRQDTQDRITMSTVLCRNRKSNLRGYNNKTTALEVRMDTKSQDLLGNNKRVDSSRQSRNTITHERT